MQPNATGFRWTAPRERAALLVAEDELNDQKIADEIGIHKVTLERWKQYPEFSARVTEHIKTLEAETLKFTIAKRRRRVAALDDRWKRMQRLVEARAIEHAEISGGDTGLLVHQEKAIGTGQNQTIIDEYAVDTGLLRELRAHEEQAAKELGQWVDKGELKVDDVGLTDEDRIARIAAILERGRQARARQTPEAGGDQLDAPAGTADAGL